MINALLILLLVVFTISVLFGYGVLSSRWSAAITTLAIVFATGSLIITTPLSSAAFGTGTILIVVIVVTAMLTGTGIGVIAKLFK